MYCNTIVGVLLSPPSKGGALPGWTPQRHPCELLKREVDYAPWTDQGPCQPLVFLHHQHPLLSIIMANGDDGRKSPWSSWLAPGDVRRAGNEAPHQSLDSNAKRQLSQEHLGQSSQLQQHGQDYSATSEDTYNPLIAFKHFVDDRIAAIVEFPSKITELKRTTRDLSAASEDLERAHKRWTGHDQKWAVDFHRLNGELLPDVLGEAKELAAMLIRESDWRNRHVPSEKITALCEDKEFNPNRNMEANSPWPFHYRISFNQSQESVASLTHWLSVNWFKNNPYSPVNLEVDPLLAKYDTKWRHSFEDLLEASLDKPMTSQNKYGVRPFSKTTRSTWHGPGRDWMFSLQCRGILPPQLPSTYSQGWAPTDYSTTPAKDDAGILAKGRVDLDLLVREIALNIIQDGAGARPAASSHDWKTSSAEAEFDAEGAEFESDERICPRHTGRQPSEDYAYETSLAERYYRDQLSGNDEANASANRCPDEMGRAVSQAARETETGLTELDLYELQVEHVQAVDRAQAEYFRQLKILEKRLQEAVGEKDTWQQAAQDEDEYDQQIKLLEERNPLRFVEEMEEEEEEEEEDIDVDEAAGQLRLQYYQQQLKLLQEENARRLLEARRDEARDVDGPAGQQTPLQAYQQQLKLLEEQNARRLMQTRRDQADMSEIARQQATRAFADEENGLGEDGSLGRHRSSRDETAAQEYEDFYGLSKDRPMSSEELSAHEASRLYSEIDSLAVQQTVLGKRMNALVLDQKALVERQEAREQKQAPRMLEQESPVADQSALFPSTTDSNRPQVLSTLTTTQTTRLPDGSIKTTVVLKRRFADGGEETQESTQTSFDEPSAVGGAVGKEPSKEKKSWFWS
jgi:hypothetical protein